MSERKFSIDMYENAKQMKYVVEIEIELGEYTLVRDKAVWSEEDQPAIFDTIKEAQAEANKWNTGVVIEYRS